MTAELLLFTDTKAILEDIHKEARAHDLFFDTSDASVIRVGSDHGADYYVITGLVEANRFDVFVCYLEVGDARRLSIMQVPEDGDPAFTREPLLWGVE